MAGLQDLLAMLQQQGISPAYHDTGQAGQAGIMQALAPQMAHAAPQPAAHEFSGQQGMSAPQPAPTQPQGGSGGGIGAFLGNLFGGGQQGQQQQVQQAATWLMKDGYDQGTAMAIAQNPDLMKKVIEQRIQAPDPMAPLKMEKLGLEVEQMRNPTTDDIKEYQFAKQQGYAGTLPEFMMEMKRAGATNVTTNVGGETLTPGQKKIDEAFADTYLSWQGGGYADAAKQLTQLNESLGILESAAAEGRDITGMIGVLPQAVQPFINPEGTIAREGVEEVVQRSLREILGAQFTEKEGERLIARAYNPVLKPAENAKRVRRLIGQIQGMAEARQEMVDYFDEHGTLRGYKGRRPSLSALENIESEWEREDSRAPGNARSEPSASNNDPLGIR